jgi:acetone carboxylase gamma subunit
MQVSDALEVDGGVVRCLRCQTDLASARENYKLKLPCEETPIEAANPHIRDPARYVDDRIVLRRFYCSGCGVLIDTEVSRAQDPPVWDIQIAG